MPAQERQPDGQSAKVANAALTLLACTVAAVGAAFVWPWLARFDPGGRALNEYAPVHNGGARLVADYDASGAVTSWTSDNDIVLPPGVALAADLRTDQRAAIEKFFRRAGETSIPHDELIRRLGETQLYQTRSRQLDAEGKVTETVSLNVRDARGDFLIAMHDAAAGLDLSFDPPLQTLSSKFEPGHKWEATGVRSSSRGSDEYRYRGHIIGREDVKNAAGESTSCWKVETRIAFLSNDETHFERVNELWLAPGVGSVETRQTDASGVFVKRTALIAGPGAYNDGARLPAPAKPPAADAPKIAPPSEWKLTRFASRRVATGAPEHTTRAAWAPGDPSMLLTAVFEGGLTAFATDGGTELWRFDPGASIYAEPTVDAARGRIYFGAADKRLYALDTRGLFLWSFAARDNVGTRPLVAGDSVIFGSEDRTIYSLNADTGRLNWSARAAAPVASSPALAGDLAVFGSDDGGVYAINIRTGKEEWRFDAAAPVEAPVVFAAAKLFACTHQGDVFAINENGNEIWRNKLPRAIRSAPAVHRERLWLIEDGGQLSAFDLQTGRRTSRTLQTDYVGSPLALDGELIVASRSGDVHSVDEHGAVRQSWRAAETLSPSDGPPTLRFGAATGGGALWFADRRGVVRRLGGAPAGPLTLRAPWMRGFAREPFTQHFINVTPVVHRDKVLVVDDSGDIFRFDAPAGEGERIGSIGQQGRVAIEPTVAHDTLLTVSGQTLVATGLPECTPLWKFDGGGNSLHPVAFTRDLALWMTQQEQPGADKSQPSRGTLFALDLRTGAARWQKPLTGFTAIGGVVAHQESIYTSTPPAALSATGVTRWELQTEDSGLGGPALNEPGDVLFVGAINLTTGRSLLRALTTADGRVLWQADLGASALNPTERPWPAGKVVIVPLWGGEIVALDSASGAEVWRHKPEVTRYGGITVAEGLVWFALQNSRIVALNADTGVTFAQLNLDIDLGSVGVVAPRPLLTGNRVLVPLATVLLGIEKPPPEETAAPKSE